MDTVAMALFVKVFSVAAYMFNSPACVSRSRIALYRVGAIGEANKCEQPTLCMGWKIVLIDLGEHFNCSEPWI